MDNLENDHVIEDSYEISTLIEAQELTPNMVSVNDLFQDQCILSQEEKRLLSNTGHIQIDVHAQEERGSSTNGHVLLINVPNYSLSNKNPHYSNPLEKPSTMVPLRDLFIGKSSSSQVEANPIVNQSIEQLSLPGPNVSPKKMRRMMANRKAAERSRIRKVEYKASLEERVKQMEMDKWRTQSLIMKCEEENSQLRQENYSLMEKKIIMEIESEANERAINKLKLEREQLKQTIMMQSLYGRSTSTNAFPNAHGGSF